MPRKSRAEKMLEQILRRLPAELPSGELARKIGQMLAAYGLRERVVIARDEKLGVTVLCFRPSTRLELEA
ncbi:MAG: hypothetical protein QXR87_05230 [Candidatus Hadarchaeales archaeon]